jgi:hypothetical protein
VNARDCGPNPADARRNSDKNSITPLPGFEDEDDDEDENEAPRH